MKRFSRKNFFLSATLLLIGTGSICAQQPKPATALPPTPAAQKETKAPTDKRSAKVLFDEARTYIDKAFAEFNKQKVPYDRALEAKTKQEQKDLAAKNAAILQARKLTDADLYYLGMLHYTAANEDGALEAMRRYLGGALRASLRKCARRLVLYRRGKTIPEASGPLRHTRKISRRIDGVVGMRR